MDTFRHAIPPIVNEQDIDLDLLKHAERVIEHVGDIACVPVKVDDGGEEARVLSLDQPPVNDLAVRGFDLHVLVVWHVKVPRRLGENPVRRGRVKYLS